MDQKKPRRPRKPPSPPGTKRKKITAVLKALRGRPRKEAIHRDVDRQTLVAVACDLVAESGSAALTVRGIAARTGKSVGSVYSTFPSLDALRHEVNAATLGRLREWLAEALARCPDRSIEQLLICLADAYTSFADHHRTMWAALFETNTVLTPPAVSAQIAGLFELLEALLRETGCASQDAPVVAQTLWASVHGTVYLAGTGSLGPIEKGNAPAAVHALVGILASGLTARRTMAAPRRRSISRFRSGK